MRAAPSDRPWPPLIVADQVPRLVRWRDASLTVLAWGAFALLLEKEFAPVLGALQALGVGDFGVKIDWLAYLQRLTPFLVAVAVLACLLVGFSLRTLRRRDRALTLPQPAALGAADEARRAGLSVAELAVARDQRIVVVHMDDEGLRVEAKAAVAPVQAFGDPR
jgi:poly-beta-1,6-N-acetyl-D-glucosamine biosynthesis protein PgaD